MLTHFFFVFPAISVPVKEGDSEVPVLSVLIEADLPLDGWGQELLLTLHFHTHVYRVKKKLCKVAISS